MRMRSLIVIVKKDRIKTCIQGQDSCKVVRFDWVALMTSFLFIYSFNFVHFHPNDFTQSVE